MRLNNILLRRFILPTACAGVMTLWIATGCMPAKPGYMLDTEAMCEKLKAVNARENVAGWAAGVIQSHLPAATNRPTSFMVTNAPSWINEIYDSHPLPFPVTYEIDPNNDNVSIDWITGRGCWGILLGGPKYVPGKNWPS